jgi:hypothetical protein
MSPCFSGLGYDIRSFMRSPSVNRLTRVSAASLSRFCTAVCKKKPPSGAVLSSWLPHDRDVAESGERADGAPLKNWLTVKPSHREVKSLILKPKLYRVQPRPLRPPELS